MKTFLISALVVAATLASVRPARSHCEIPCGIYNDRMRLDMIAEYITTIEKSMNQIVELSAAGDKNYNQIVRWVTNKEEHANELQHVVTQYFLTQRIKPVDPASGEEYAKYQKHLELLHKMLVFAMKAKQTTDLAHVATLRALAAEFRASYLGPEGEAHTH
jgi:nickel superoxide dismutase